VVDYVPIRTSGEQQGERSALVAVTPEEPVILHLERLRRAGLVVDALEIAPVSVCRLFSRLGTHPRTDVSLILRLRSKRAQLTLLSGRRLLLYREVEIGFDAILAEVSKALDCDAGAARDLLALYGVRSLVPGAEVELDPDATALGLAGSGDIVSTLRETIRPALRGIVEQAHKAISYAAFQTRGMTLDRVYLMEGIMPCPGLQHLLSDMLQLPVDTFDPLDGLPGAPTPERSLRGERYSIALGMALRGLDDV
jgi:Tfp pilus assembly PilM family ATPase